MEIVIKLSDRALEFVKENGIKDIYGIEEAICNGIVLPKGHGDLKDIGNIRLEKFCRIENISLNPRFSEEFKKGYNAAVDDVLYVLMSAPVLIEADKEVDE